MSAQSWFLVIQNGPGVWESLRYLYATWWWHVTPPTRAWPLSCQTKPGKVASSVLTTLWTEQNNKSPSSPALDLMDSPSDMIPEKLSCSSIWNQGNCGCRNSGSHLGGSGVCSSSQNGSGYSTGDKGDVSVIIREEMGLEAQLRADWAKATRRWEWSMEIIKKGRGASLVCWPFPPAYPAFPIKPLGCWDYTLLRQPCIC